MKVKKINFSELDDELEAILYDENYKSIRDLWNSFNVPLRDVIWYWFLWSYSKIYPEGIFDSGNKMKREAEEEYDGWIEKNMSKINAVFKM